MRPINRRVNNKYGASSSRYVCLDNRAGERTFHRQRLSLKDHSSSFVTVDAAFGNLSLFVRSRASYMGPGGSAGGGQRGGQSNCFMCLWSVMKGDRNLN